MGTGVSLLLPVPALLDLAVKSKEKNKVVAALCFLVAIGKQLLLTVVIVKKVLKTFWIRHLIKISNVV